MSRWIYEHGSQAEKKQAKEKFKRLDSTQHRNMAGVAKDTLKFHSGIPCPTLSLRAVSGVAHHQGKQPAAIFYHL
jgi:hypothetical protein